MLSGGGKQGVLVETRDNCAIIRLGPKSEKIAVLSEERMESLAEAIKNCGEDHTLLGVLIVGASSAGFCAGADIKVLQQMNSRAEGERLATKGQAVFQALEKLAVPTVAAIRGACVGGGCELVLACKHRIMSASHDSKIGLPEVRLGIVPGFGGTQRLPRLIGLPAALDFIVKGKVASAGEAKKIGLVDLLVEDDGDESQAQKKLEEVGLAVLLGRKKLSKYNFGSLARILTYTSIGRNFVKNKALQAVKKETKGHYPAPIRAIEIAVNGLEFGASEGYRQEVTAIGSLATSDVSKSLIHVFLASENSSKLGKSAAEDVREAAVLVLGAGVMGSGIATSFLAKGHKVTLIDSFPEALAKAETRITEFINSRRNFSLEKKQQLLSNLTLGASITNPESVGLAIEAIVEEYEVKRTALQKLVPQLSEKAIIATNTSSLSVKALSAAVSRPERFIGLHFFNPVEKMPLLEIVRGEKTDEKTLVRAAALASRIGKSPIIVEDVPGFLVNRILTPYLVQAAVLFSEGVSVEEIDNMAVKFGMPMGPFRLLDEVGLDVAAKVQSIIGSAYGERMNGPALADALLAEGRKGKKSGKGFYVYSSGRAEFDREVPRLLNLEFKQAASCSERDITDRLIYPMINEAILCLDEGVAGKPGVEAASQIDLGSVMGTGFAPFRGGILFYAERLGVKALYERFKELEKRFGVAFKAAPGLEIRMKDNRGFFS